MARTGDKSIQALGGTQLDLPLELVPDETLPIPSVRCDLHGLGDSIAGKTEAKHEK